jgi:hypothetical protein
MPIEDVDYLLRTSTEECSTLFVDSSTRDRLHYPTPSEYVVDLEEPIRNVFGMDILDAVVPNTIYNVNARNNSLRVLSIDFGDSSVAVADDAALSGELYKLGHASPLGTWTADAARGTFRVAVLGQGQRVASAGSAAIDDGVGYFALVEARPLVGVRLAMLSSGTGAAAADAAATPTPTLAFSGSTYAPIEAAGAAALSAFLAVPRESAAAFALVQSGTDLAPSAPPGRAVAYDVVTYAATRLAGGAAQMQAVRAGVVRPRLVLTLSSAELEVGFYTKIASLQTSMQTALDAAGLGVSVSIDGTSTSGVDRQNLFRLSCDASTRLLLCAAQSSVRSVLGFDLVADAAATTSSALGAGAAAPAYSALRLGGESEPMFASVLGADGRQAITAPGLINLIGVQYVTLRCREIEQYMGNVGKYGKFSTGIGVFKLLGSNEVAQLRFDYVSLIRKPLHPIGRLRRLTLRFELPDGSLFDFKGINHQILLSVKYYLPDPRRRTPADGPVSVLNPDYDPDFMRFIQRRDEHAAREADDLGFADDPRTADADDPDGDPDDADDPDDELAAYVFGRQRRRPPPQRGNRTRSEFLKFSVAQQNQVLATERALVKPFAPSTDGRPRARP